ncbi:MAG: CheR family methyltransferase, partial [Bacteroidota bacterium]
EKISFIDYDLLSETEYCPPECIYGDFDLVICSNVLFYYKPLIRDRILGKITRCLKMGGFLITGEAERELIPPKIFSEMYPPSAIFSKKINYEKP